MIVVMIGRWSLFSSTSVCQCAFWARLFEMVVMSGEVLFWLWLFVLLKGMRVGVLVFRMVCVLFCMMSRICVPLWSSSVECHACECAFMSPVRIVLGEFVMFVRMVVV